MFVTVFYVVINTVTKKIKYSNGGHCNQFLIRKKNQQIIKLNSLGKPLGIFENIKYEEKSENYDDGDFLLLFTDGVAEFFSKDEKDVEDGENVLSKMALKYINEEPVVFLNFMKNELQEKQNLEDRDDFTFIIVKL